MSSPVADKSLERDLISRITSLEKAVQQMRTNQNQAIEVYIQAHPQHTDRWTQSDTYVDVVGAFRQIDFNDWKNHNMYFEMVGFVDDGVGSWKVVNVADGSMITNSEITTTSTTPTRVRSAALVKPSGVTSLKLQHKQTGGSGTGYVNSVMSSYIFRFN